jgi:hypothetical protein
MVLDNPRLFRYVFAGLLEGDPIVRMRAADAVEKITARKPELLQKFKKPLLERVALLDQQEVQWHVAQMIPRLDLSKTDVARVRRILDNYLKTTQSNIVRVMALQAFADLASAGKLGKTTVIRRIESHADTIKAPSVRARSRKLLKQLSGAR